jgi:galactokinase
MNSNLKLSLINLYKNNTEFQSTRYSKLADKFLKQFGDRSFRFFSSPGRTELSGNHTDHNHGKVIAASIDLDSIACAAKCDSTVQIYSDGYEKPFIVSLDNLNPVDDESGTSNALIRGIASRFVEKGFNVGGFKACITSDVLQGSGLSSSASIEILIGTIFNHLYNSGNIPTVEIAKIGQYAENVYFKKPCGLMDQFACAVGGIISIDFYNSENPVINKVNFDFHSTGYKLIVVDTEANHADLTEDYAAIPNEMQQVAKYFNKKFCSEISLEQLLHKINSLRDKVSDRAILRAIHFFEENKRVEKQIDALNKNDFKEFLRLVNESGNSSYKYLQNIYSPHNVEEQEVSLALALSDIFIKEKGKGACRVHGGGFAGTIQLFLPEELVDDYRSFITKVFKENSVKVLSIRHYGAVCLTSL